MRENQLGRGEMIIGYDVPFLACSNSGSAIVCVEVRVEDEGWEGKGVG